MGRVSLEQIRELCDRIAREFRPHRIVLFGSYARGDATADSDVDLLVIMPLDSKPVTKSVEIRMKVRPPFPVDLLVRTPERVRERLEMGDSFMRDVLDNGKLLYAADHG